MRSKVATLCAFVPGVLRSWKNTHGPGKQVMLPVTCGHFMQAGDILSHRIIASCGRVFIKPLFNSGLAFLAGAAPS
jgi:hypothetical protein